MSVPGTRPTRCTKFQYRREAGRFPEDHDPSPGPPAQLGDTQVEVVVDPQLACFERPELLQGEPEPSRHLHLSQPQPLTVSGEV